MYEHIKTKQKPKTRNRFVLACLSHICRKKPVYALKKASFLLKLLA